jgi:hypothetical protein
MISFHDYLRLGAPQPRIWMYAQDVYRSPNFDLLFWTDSGETRIFGWRWSDYLIDGYNNLLGGPGSPGFQESDLGDYLAASKVFTLNSQGNVAGGKLSQPVNVDYKNPGDENVYGTFVLNMMQQSGYNWPSVANTVSGAGPVDLSFIRDTLGISGEIDFSKFYSGNNAAYDTAEKPGSGIASFPAVTTDEINLRHFYGKLANTGLTYDAASGTFNGTVSLSTVATLTSDTTWSPSSAGTYVFLLINGGESGHIVQRQTGTSLTAPQTSALYGGSAGSVIVAWSKLSANQTFDVTVGAGGAGVNLDTHGFIRGNRGGVTSIGISNIVECGPPSFSGFDNDSDQKAANHHGYISNMAHSGHLGVWGSNTGAKGQGIFVGTQGVSTSNSVSGSFFSSVSGSYGTGTDSVYVTNSSPVSLSTTTAQDGVVKIYKVV